jgi:hypothetical protein
MMALKPADEAFGRRAVQLLQPESWDAPERVQAEDRGAAVGVGHAKREEKFEGGHFLDIFPKFTKYSTF